MVLPNTDNSCLPTFGGNESPDYFLFLAFFVEMALRLGFDSSLCYELSGFLL